MYTLDIPLSSLSRALSLLFVLISLFLTIFFLTAATSSSTGIQRLYALEVTFNNTPGLVLSGTSIQFALPTSKSPSPGTSEPVKPSSEEKTPTNSKDDDKTPPTTTPTPPPARPTVSVTATAGTSAPSPTPKESIMLIEPPFKSTVTPAAHPTPSGDWIYRRSLPIPRIIGVNDNGCNDGVLKQTVVFHYGKRPMQIASEPVRCTESECGNNGVKQKLTKVVKDGKIVGWELVKVPCNSPRERGLGRRGVKREELVGVVLEHEGACEGGVVEKRWRMELPDGESSTLTHHDACDTPGLTKRTVKKKEEEPCKKGLRNKLFEYRYRNHVERYWLPVPCVECQRRAKRGVVLVGRDENGQIFPRIAPGVDCQRDISDELDLDMRGDIVSKRSLWSPLLAHHYSAHRGGAGKNRLPTKQDNANQITPILVDEDELPPSYTITPGPCISSHHAISLAPIYNGTIILPCTTLEKRGRKKNCMENRTLLIEFRNVTHCREVLLPCGRELSLPPKNASVSEDSTAPGRNETFDLKIEGQKLPEDLGFAVLGKRDFVWGPCKNGQQTMEVTYVYTTRVEEKVIRRRCNTPKRPQKRSVESQLVRRHHDHPEEGRLRMGYYTLCSVAGETKCVNSRGRNTTELMERLGLSTSAHEAVWKAVATQKGLVPELPLLSVVLLSLSLLTGTWPFFRAGNKHLHRASLLLLELALTFILLAICNIAWVLKGVEAGSNPALTTLTIAGDEVELAGEGDGTRVSIGHNGMVVAGVAVLFGVMAGAGLAFARMGEERAGWDGKSFRSGETKGGLGRNEESDKGEDGARVESVVDMYAEMGAGEVGGRRRGGEKVDGATLAPGEKVPGWWGANEIGRRV